MSAIIALLIALVVMVPIALLGGVVLSDLWAWFVVPVFPTAPTLTTIQAVGIAIVAGFFKSGLKTVDITENYDDDAPIVKTLARSSFSALLYLGIWGYGALWHTFT